MTEFEKLQADLIAQTQNEDTEGAHIEADKILCMVALSLTLSKEEREELIELWTKVSKWYS